MKKILYGIIAGTLVINNAFFVYAQNNDISTLTTTELETLKEDISEAVDIYHSLDSDMKEKILESVKIEVESYADENDIAEVDWAWFDYNYTREWDYCTLKSHADFDDVEKKIYAEVLFENSICEIYYLSIGTDTLIDNTKELPETLWTTQPEAYINDASGIDLSILSPKELNSLTTDVKDELSKYHDPDSVISDKVLELVKKETEKYFSDYELSWPWFDYTYTREWNLYTLDTSVSYKENDSTNEAYIQAQAYPFDKEYSLVYFKIDSDVVLDKTSDLPKDIANDGISAKGLKNRIKKAQQEKAQQEKTQREKALQEKAEKEKAEKEKAQQEKALQEKIQQTEAPQEEASNETPKTICELGSKGETVRKLQSKLIELGLLTGKADGDFGKMTKSAVELFQKNNNLNITGIITDKDWNILFPNENPPVSNNNPTPQSSQTIKGNLTIDNCPALKNMLLNKADMDSSYSIFANQYRGKTIEFEGIIADLTHHGNYKTRFDVLINYNNPNGGITGPYFQFRDVNIYDMNVSSDSLRRGDRATIKAKVKNYNSNTGLFALDPVAVIVK